MQLAMNIRASTAGDANTGTQQKLVVDGLTYQPSTYYYLKLFNENTGASFVLNGNTGNNGGGSSGAYYSIAFTFSTTYSTTYRYRAEAKYLSSSALTTVYVNYTSPAPPPPPSTPTISKVSETGKTITLRASISSNTTTVEWDDTRWNGAGYDVVSTGGATTTDRSWTVPSYSTTYQWDVIAKNANGSSSWSSIYSWTSPPAPVPPAQVNVGISGLGGNSFFVDLSGGSGSTTMNIEVRTGSQTGTIVWSRYGQALSPQFTVTGLYEYTNYYIKAYGTNANGNGTAGLATTKTLDKTVPTVGANYDGEGRMFINFYGADVTPTGGGASGLSNYRVWISPRNSSSLNLGYDVLSLVNTYFTFETDADGLNFANGSYYTLGVKSLDNAGNWSLLASQAVTYVKVRPNNWNWSTTKVQGNYITTVTASEWESLGKAINQFRTYKSLVVRDFIVPLSGNEITATIFNQYCNGIRDMTPPTSPPANKVSGNYILASDFTLLTTSLNSIT